MLILFCRLVSVTILIVMETEWGSADWVIQPMILGLLNCLSWTYVHGSWSKYVQSLYEPRIRCIIFIIITISRRDLITYKL
jgi:hypothetical protein